MDYFEQFTQDPTLMGFGQVAVVGPFISEGKVRYHSGTFLGIVPGGRGSFVFRVRGTDYSAKGLIRNPDGSLFLDELRKRPQRDLGERAA